MRIKRQAPRAEMPNRRPPCLHLAKDQKDQLERWVHAPTTEVRLVLRSGIILLLAEGLGLVTRVAGHCFQGVSTHRGSLARPVHHRGTVGPHQRQARPRSEEIPKHLWNRNHSSAGRMIVGWCTHNRLMRAAEIGLAADFAAATRNLQNFPAKSFSFQSRLRPESHQSARELRGVSRFPWSGGLR